jgi:predicted restriction endonuclease
MKETGKPEVFEFLEEYEAEERKSEDNYNPNQDTDMDFQVPPGDEREVTVSERVHQREFREGLLRKYPHCCLCSVANKELLFASHIKPWEKSTSEEKTNLNNGLLLCPNHDKLFDKGFISFDSNGSILISS